MSLFESGESNGQVSLADIIAGRPVEGMTTLPLDRVAAAIVRGGWPASVAQADDFSGRRAANYADSIAEHDSSRVDGIEKNPKRVKLLMRSLARNESSEAAMTTLRADMAADEGDLSASTIAQYLSALRKLYVLEEQEPWAPAVRSKVAQRTATVRRFCDPSIPAALLRLAPEKLLTDFNTFGLLFESLCVRDLRTYTEANDAAVWHYRDLRGLECDAIVEAADGTWGAVEVKLEKTREDQAAANLSKLRDVVASQHGGPASFLLILTSDGYAYQRSDGIYSVPIGCLGP
jgi:predicted AAA+ superfamily ATPase